MLNVCVFPALTFVAAVSISLSILGIVAIIVVTTFIFTTVNPYHYFYSLPVITKVIEDYDKEIIGTIFDGNNLNNINLKKVYATPENASLYSRISNNSVSSSSSSLLNIITESGSRRLEYNARFLCGTIAGENGPLRPGQYNSDINIFNRQNFQVSFLWRAVLSPGLAQEDRQEANSDSILLTLDSGNSISISCKDIRKYLSIDSNGSSTIKNRDFFEGVMTISVELDPSIQSPPLSSSSFSIGDQDSSSNTALSSPSVPLNATTEPNINILSVDAIYMVNALEVTNREIVLQLIEYSINKQDENRKIPNDIISQTLSLTLPIRTNETVDPEKQVRSFIMKEFSLNPAEARKLDVSIRNLSLGVGDLDDNNAVSLPRINAFQLSPQP